MRGTAGLIYYASMLCCNICCLVYAVLDLGPSPDILPCWRACHAVTRHGTGKHYELVEITPG